MVCCQTPDLPAAEADHDASVPEMQSVTSSFRGIFAAAALALLAPMHVEAQQSYEATQVYRLPVYCKYTQVFRDHVPGGNNRPEIERWTASMGGSFNHMHHYCWGLMATNRAAFFSSTRQ